jgi:hypothetical protein
VKPAVSEGKYNSLLSNSEYASRIQLAHKILFPVIKIYVNSSSLSQDGAESNRKYCDVFMILETPFGLLLRFIYDFTSRHYNYFYNVRSSLPC